MPNDNLNPKITEECRVIKELFDAIHLQFCPLIRFCVLNLRYDFFRFTSTGTVHRIECNFDRIRPDNQAEFNVMLFHKAIAMASKNECRLRDSWGWENYTLVSCKVRILGSLRRFGEIRMRLGI